MDEKIRLLIGDGNEIMRRGLGALISKEKDIEVTGLAASADEVLELADRDPPDVVLVDLKMQSMNGAQLVKRLHEKRPETRCIVFTNYDETDKEHIYTCIRAGAEGYLLKSIGYSDLVDGIKTVHRGESILSPKVAARVFDKFKELSRGKENGEMQLSEREKDVVKLIARGLSNKQLADRLFISTKTVKTHVAHILSKLKAKNRTEAVITALKRGDIDIETEPET